MTEPSIEPSPATPQPAPPTGAALLRVLVGGEASQMSYRDFLDTLGVAVYTTDADGRITFYNEAAAAFWGRRPEEGELWCGSWRLFWPDGRPMRHDECPMAAALQEDREVRGVEAVAERPDGSRVSFVPYPSPLHDAFGRVIGAVNVLVDVTERTRIEESLRATAASLQASADALRDSNAVKDEFLGLVSHELRTPVTTIFGNARLLNDRGDRLDDAARRSMVDDIAADSDRLLAIIENLLLLTRLGAGMHIDLEPQILDHIVARTVDSFRRRHPTRSVILQQTRGHIVVDADRTALELVLENLLGNADKYSPDSTDIEVALSVHDGESRLRVADRGIGIDPIEADQVFEPFYRGEEARSTANGVGIGLAVCRRVIEIQGGRIWVDARPDGGTEVTVAMPIAADDD